ncbi:MAG: hypothetical protein R3E12_15410 [Candidatus Eisenbacteria bacterium]
MESPLPGDWVGSEMRAYLSGGTSRASEAVRPDGHRADPVDEIDRALQGLGVDRLERVLLRRSGEQAPLHMLFDRTTGRFSPFVLPYDPVAFGARNHMDRERSRGECRVTHPVMTRFVPPNR